MARASLISQARGSRVYNDGDSVDEQGNVRRSEVYVMSAESFIAENLTPIRHVCDGPIKCCQPDCSVCGIDDSANFERMMRANRAVGL